MPRISKYLSLLKEKREPYFTVAKLVVEKVEGIYNKTKNLSDSSEEVKVYFAINPAIIQKELEEKTGKKLSTSLICWTVRALFLGSKFKKYRVSSGSGGVKRFCLEINETNLSIFKNFIKSIEKNQNK